VEEWKAQPYRRLWVSTLDEGSRSIFDPAWQTITIDLPHGDIFIAVRVHVDNQAFWKDCCVRSAEIRQGSIASGTLLGWIAGHPSLKSGR